MAPDPADLAVLRLCERADCTYAVNNAVAEVKDVPICRLRPLDAVLSSGLCGKEGALPPVTGLTVQRIICC